MVMAGLLWYDDDGRRPLTAKIIEAAERYRERLGFEPTVCQLPPQQWTALTAAVAHPKRSRTPVVPLPRSLRLESDEHLSANYFLLGMGEDDLVIPNPLLAPDDPPVRARRGGHAPSARQSAQPSRPAQRAPVAKPAAVAVTSVEANPLGETPKPRRSRTSKASMTPPAPEVAVSAPASAGAQGGRAAKMPAPTASVADTNALKPKVRATKPSAKIPANEKKPTRLETTVKAASVTLTPSPRPVKAKRAVQSSTEKPIRRTAPAKAKATKVVPSDSQIAAVAQVSLWDSSVAAVQSDKRSSRVNASTPATAPRRRTGAASKTAEAQRPSTPRETSAKAAKVAKANAKTTQRAAETPGKVRDTSPISARAKVAPVNAPPVKPAKTPKKSQGVESNARSSVIRVTKTTAPKTARKAPVTPEAAKTASPRSRRTATPTATKATAAKATAAKATGTKARAKAANATPASVPSAAATSPARKSPASGRAQATPPPQTTTRRRLAKSA
jgi:hypothetical protein